jgi:hypothetical protein
MQGSAQQRFYISPTDKHLPGRGLYSLQLPITDEPFNRGGSHMEPLRSFTLIYILTGPTKPTSAPRKPGRDRSIAMPAIHVGEYSKEGCAQLMRRCLRKVQPGRLFLCQTRVNGLNICAVVDGHFAGYRHPFELSSAC